MKVINPTDKSITIKRNAKLADDVYPCLAAEELQLNDSSYLKSNSLHATAEQTPDLSDTAEALTECGLSDLCDVCAYMTPTTRWSMLPVLCCGKPDESCIEEETKSKRKLTQSRHVSV